MAYGYELVLDLHNCKAFPLDRDDLTMFLIELCREIDMKREDLHFWDYHDDPEGYEAAPAHLKGASCTQFIKTSTIVIHTLDDMQEAFINVFSCKEFDADIDKWIAAYFGADIRRSTMIERG